MVNFGLDVDQFWDLSWYEWGLYVQRAENQVKVEHSRQEQQWAMTRIIWATIMNRWRGPNERQYKPEDLMPLSFDKPEEPTGAIDPEDAFKKLGKTFKKDA